MSGLISGPVVRADFRCHHPMPMQSTPTLGRRTQAARHPGSEGKQMPGGRFLGQADVLPLPRRKFPCRASNI
jgi:hypothetical protein